MRFKLFETPKSNNNIGSSNDNDNNLKQKSERNTAKSVAVAVVVARRRHHLFFIVVVVFVSTVAVASFSATYYKIKLEFRNERTFAFARLNEQRCDITTSLAINSTSKSNNSIADSHTHTYIHTVKRTEAAAELCCCSIIIIYHQQQRRCRCFVVFTLAHSRTHTDTNTGTHIATYMRYSTNHHHRLFLSPQRPSLYF